MKIIRLQASNIKKLSAINIAPDGNVVTLAGDNGAGKSSVLDAIAYALGARLACVLNRYVEANPRPKLYVNLTG